MPSTLPDGDPVPEDGSLPDSAFVGAADRTLSFYLHVPFCATRCGYCDFNTYTAGELGSATSAQSWYEAALLELDLAAAVLKSGPTRPISTVFVGGGTPSLVGAQMLGGLLDRLREHFDFIPDAEITTEANPESTDPALLAGLLESGYTRLSLGMQSSSARVLKVLDRRHTPGRPEQVVRWAAEAGFEHLNLDLIYGSPGESAAEFADSLAAVVGSGVDHVSAYSLIVEPGTRMDRLVRTGALIEQSDDVLADRYLMADSVLTAAGFEWYEVSNWATDTAARCRHNLAYWQGGDWWGIGPGAHSHVGGVRWWNVKHPLAYGQALGIGRSPGHARELLDQQARHTEDILLRLRLVDGLPLELLDEAGRAEIAAAVDEGLVEPASTDRAVLTLQGRLLADGLALRLLP